ncbi:capsular polysaccharide biosynthesis protein [Xenococcus sp. PCC 7305]|uniref:tetratricopeptide repeat protein n=1 Tax=Xenococcus sp. PCC 7305 TaxID=102125 RepID=UPI0002AC2B1B|nr:tetratricopeptide repeat protein [Xenococcus sp. PCC 7305]ELS05062.1 capsular polysaccharide biosynthesis protein [Xenococcus sp. PCC 7305]
MASEPTVEQIIACMAQREWSHAIAICAQLLKDNPEQQEVYPLLAKAYANQGDFDKAITAYHISLGNQPEQAQICAELGLLYSKQKKFTQAISNYQKAIALKPTWAEIYYNLAVIWHEVGDWEQTITAYQQAVKHKPNYTAAYFNLGLLYDNRGQWNEAVANYQRAIELQPYNIRAYSNLGSTLARHQKYESAIEVLQQGLKIDPTWATLHNNLGQVLWLEGRLDQALVSFELALSLEPDMVLANHNLSRLWQQESNYDRAFSYLQEVTELEPNNSSAHNNCLSILLKKGNLQAAIPHWQYLISIRPEFVDYYLKQATKLNADNLLAQGKIACANFIKAIRENSDKSQIHHHLWKTLFYWGEMLFDYGGVGINRAEIYYQYALDIKPDEVELYLRLGNCFKKQNRTNAAISMYQMGLCLQSNHPQISFQLAKLLEKPHSSSLAIEDNEDTVILPPSNQSTSSNKLQNLFKEEKDLAPLPQAIYHYTHDWIRNCQIEDYNYVEISWPGTSTQANKLKQIASEPITDIDTTTSNLNCTGVHCPKCISELIELFEPRQIAKNVYQLIPDKFPQIDSPLPFVVTIPQGKAWIAPYKNAWVVCNGLAVMTPDGYLLGDLSRYYLWFLPNCPYKHQKDHILYQLDSLPKTTKLDGKVALLSAMSGHVYYHWMFDILPRLDLIKKSGISWDSIDWFVVNNIDKDFQTETLNYLGIPLNKVILSDHDSLIQAEELIVPSFPGYQDWVPEGSINFLRDVFLAKVNLDNEKYPQKIYISRSRSSSRHVINEKEVVEKLTPLGFQTVFLEELSLTEQIALFANAKVIMSTHGSGLTNLVFCSPDTIVIELFSPHYVRTYYWIIAQQLKLKYYYYLGEVFDCKFLRDLMYQNSLTEDILVNFKSLNAVLKLAGIIT